MVNKTQAEVLEIIDKWMMSYDFMGTGSSASADAYEAEWAADREKIVAALNPAIAPAGGELIERIMALVEDERMDGEAECEHRNACREEIRALLNQLAAPQDGEAEQPAADDAFVYDATTTVNDLRQQLAATIAERDRAVKDAERYRWLRGEGFERGATIWVVEWKTGIPIVHTDLDERIDADIAAGGDGGRIGEAYE